MVKLSDSNYQPGSGPYYPHGEHCEFHNVREPAEFWDWACCKMCQHRFRTEGELGAGVGTGGKCPLCGAESIRIVGEPGRVKPEGV